MYSKVLFAVIVAVLGIFVYIHTLNPGEITFNLTGGRVYTLPSTLLLFIGFLVGAGMAVANSLLSDARRAVKDVMTRRERRQAAEADETFREGIEALAIGDTVSARALIEKAWRARQDDVGVLITLADTYGREGRPREALKVIETGAAANPGSARLLSAIGRYALEAGDEAKAARAFEEILDSDAKNLNAMRKMRDILMKRGAWPQAAQMQKMIVEVEQDDFAKAKERRFATGLLFEAASKHALDGRLNDAVSRLKEVLKNDPSFMPAHLLLGDILNRQGNTRGAIRVWEKAYSRTPSIPLLLRLEDSYIKESLPDRILEKYNRELGARPDDMNIRLLLARLYLRLEMVDTAIEALESVYHDGADTYYVRMLLAEAYLRRNQSAKAAALFQQALGADKDLSPPFVCRRCAHMVRNWTPRCTACGEWDALDMTVDSESAAAAGRDGSA